MGLKHFDIFSRETFFFSRRAMFDNRNLSALPWKAKTTAIHGRGYFTNFGVRYLECIITKMWGKFYRRNKCL